MAKIFKNSISGNRQIPLEARLTQAFIIAEFVWAAFNLLYSIAMRMPSGTIMMYLSLVIGLPAYMGLGFLLHRELLFKKIYFVIFAISIPFMWYFAGGNEGSASILFVCEMVVVTMCLSGVPQKVFIVVALLTSGLVSSLSHALPFYQPYFTDPRTIAMGSRALGSSTTILIAFILLYQKGEYMRERDAAVSAEKELENSNRMQKNFLANMSHEIRSPLGIVLGFNHLISESGDINKIHEYSGNIERAGKTLQTVINDILDYSKIESGKLDIISENYSLHELIQEIETDIRLRCDEKGLNFVIHRANDLPEYLYGDNIRIRQCLLNVLTNAVKYTEKGTISFTIGQSDATGDGCKLCFEIADTGKGIGAESIPHLFSAFQRLDEGQNRAIEGTGLGLAITKNLLDEMKGEIAVDSTLGEGTTFTITLLQTYGKAPKKEEARKIESLDGIKILVIDDTNMNLILMSKLLSKEKALVTTCDSGTSGLAKCNEEAFDIILLDHMMPEMDGIETFQKLRATKGPNQDTPVIMLTANAMAGVSEEYLAQGFSGYVSKPVNPPLLNESIMKVLSK